MKKCPKCNYPILSSRAEQVLKYCSKHKRVIVDDVIRELGMSVTNANNYLRWLWDVGLLERYSENLSIGGQCFVYKYKITPTKKEE